MSNTITSAILQADPRKVVVYYTLVSDGSNQSATNLYSASTALTAIQTNFPNFSNTAKTAIKDICAYAAVGSTARVELLWKATTNVMAFTIPPMTRVENCFESIGGLQNQGGSGVTGDILITTTGLASGDQIVIVLTVRPS